VSLVCIAQTQPGADLVSAPPLDGRDNLSVCLGNLPSETPLRGFGSLGFRFCAAVKPHHPTHNVSFR